MCFCAAASKAGGRGTGGGPLSRRVKEGNLRTSRRETSHLFSGAALTLSPPHVTCCDIMFMWMRPESSNVFVRRSKTDSMPEASTGSRLEVSVFGQIVGARLPSGVRNVRRRGAGRRLAGEGRRGQRAVATRERGVVRRVASLALCRAVGAVTHGRPLADRSARLPTSPRPPRAQSGCASLGACD